MGEQNTTLSESDKAQIEYIQKWMEKKEEKKRRKAVRKINRDVHLTFAKRYFKIAIKNLVLWFKCCIGKDV